MTLAEHVNHLRELIENAFAKELAMLGFGPQTATEPSGLSEAESRRRARFAGMLDNHQGETGDYPSARAKLVDELAFTLFNRLAALKVMEAARFFPPVLDRQAELGNRSAGHNAWLEADPARRQREREGLRDYLKDAFNDLGESLPLYRRDYPYALLPGVDDLDAIIEAFNAVEKDPRITVEGGLWQSDDVLGWLYESYNNAKKQVFKDSGENTEYDKVSLQSQVYTPRWVVKFLVENSLGKLYLEMYPDSEIRHCYKIVNAPTERLRERKPLTEIRLIDPACGSGNFLLYAFDFLYALYLDRIEDAETDYDEVDIPRLIIENNLHGIDLDDRGVQLAQLGLYIKARKYDMQVKNLRFQIVSSDFYLPDYEAVRVIFESGEKLDPNQKELIEKIWADVKLAYKFGSLIQLEQKLNRKVEQLIASKASGQEDLFAQSELEAHCTFVAEFLQNLKSAGEEHAHSSGRSFLSSKTRDAITFLELITSKYDIAIANPPYTDSANFGPILKSFVEDNYKNPYKFHTNLYATFIKVCDNLIADNGKIGMVHPLTFMYIKTFEGVRKYILEQYHINVLVEAGMGGVFPQHIFVDPAFYVLEKINKNTLSLFVSLSRYSNTFKQNQKREFMTQAVSDYINGKKNEHNYSLPQAKLKVIKSWPFIYWISDGFREKFGSGDVNTSFSPAQGAATTNNLRFLRFWWEVDSLKISQDYRKDRKKWVFYSKGGPYEKWHGNLWLVINYENNASELKSAGAVLRNSEVYFTRGITYSASGAKGPSFRVLPENCVFDTGGSCIFANKEFKNTEYLLGFMNSKLVAYIVNCLNPTVNAQVGDMQRVPFVLPAKNNEAEITSLVIAAVKIKEYLANDHIIEKNCSIKPLIDRKSIKAYMNHENHIGLQVLVCEAIINEKIFEVYNLTESDKGMVLAKEGKSIGGLPVTAEARNAYLAETEANKHFPLETIRDFIEALPIKEVPAEKRESIESGFPGLYQSNNDLEEFCIRHQVNPINVWYWFNQSNVIPQHRMHTLAMEFLADMIREILMEDEDGIVPLVTSAGQKVLLDRIEERFRHKGFSSAQYSSFDTVLGRPISEYVNKYFFAELSDHLNMFRELPKTPFIWHLSSGPERGFDCYLIIYKWSRDKLLRLKSVYIEHRERALENRSSDLADNLSAESQNEKERIRNQLREITIFKAKIDELLADGYNPVLDDGVGKNMAPLQQKGMLGNGYAVLNPGQLKKYLNADW